MRQNGSQRQSHSWTATATLKLGSAVLLHHGTLGKPRLNPMFYKAKNGLEASSVLKCSFDRECEHRPGGRRTYPLLSAMTL